MMPYLALCSVQIMYMILNRAACAACTGRGSAADSDFYQGAAFFTGSGCGNTCCLDDQTCSDEVMCPDTNRVIDVAYRNSVPPLLSIPYWLH